MAIKAILFDADHTLYDVRTDAAYGELFEYLAKEANSDAGTVRSVWRGHINNILKSEDARSAEKRKREYSIEIVLGQLGIIEEGRVKEIIEKSLEVFWRRVLSDLRYGEGCAEVLRRLKEKFRLAVASDEYKVNLEAKLSHVFGDWKKYFEFLVTADDTGELKPSENYSKISLERLGLKPQEVIFIGDSWERDLEPAKRRGMKTMLINDVLEGNPDFFAKDIFDAEKILDSPVG